MASQDVYQPLDIDKQSIRLLRLHKNTRGQQPSCSIFESTVDRDSYIALSYMWHPEGRESPTKSHCILLDGKDFEVADNLWQFLDIAQETYANEAVWIDAICIDQSNIKERNQQVTIMDRIYSCASSVLVWLGPGSTDTDHFLDFVNTGKWDGFFASGEPWKRRPDQILEDETHQWRPGFLEIVRNPYWARVWIVQELLQARNLTLRAGTSCTSWDAFFVPMWYQRFKGSLELAAGGKHMSHVQYARDCPAAQGGSSRPSSLQDYIICFGMQNCSDSRDRVYAMLGLAETRNTFPIDYDMKMSALVERTLLHEKFANILVAGHLVDALGFAPTAALKTLSHDFLSSTIPLDHEVPFSTIELCESDFLKETCPIPHSTPWVPYLRGHRGKVRPCRCGHCSSNHSDCIPEKGDLIAQLPNCDGLLILCKPKADTANSFRCASLVDVPLLNLRTWFSRNNLYHEMYCFLPSQDIVGSLSSINITLTKSDSNETHDKLEITLTWHHLFSIIAQHAMLGLSSGPELASGRTWCHHNRWIHRPEENEPFRRPRLPTDVQFECSVQDCVNDMGKQRCFSSKADLARHTHSVHPPEMLLDCPHKKCHRRGLNGFIRQDNLRAHLRRSHPEKLINLKKNGGTGLSKLRGSPRKSSRNTSSIRQKR
jgi:hypothetical protein